MSDGLPFDLSAQAVQVSQVAPARAWWPLVVIVLGLALSLAWGGLLIWGAVEAVAWMVT
jgi:hypothetical protein